MLESINIIKIATSVILLEKNIKDVYVFKFS